ncbi:MULTISPECIES: pyridoxal phosphate-dependent aminotransferase [Halorussus]|uniref:pyridoxal phosphate-dependent aminotransferase n=1 Tax=Halorussus TaxID=1070314 RepID=UPI00209D0A22|nr:pyridoxal phosphate-dependent aminotransferase [Halorussus vallis]USZ76174.1 pyridoxal phosphate-dependent aminotransferase [Halorussus vallis]
MFPDIEYLDWIAGRPEAAEFDLGSSDLRRAPPEAGALAPPALASVPDPAPEETVETLVAEAYGVDAENVLVTAGATHANFLAAAAALRAEESSDADGDDGPSRPRVLVEKPGYEPLRASPAGLGAKVDRFLRKPADDYALDVDRVDGAVTDDHALVTVTNRHNPSGRRVGRETLADVAGSVATAGASLLVDEVYASFGAEPADESLGTEERTGPFGGPTAVGLPNTVVTNSLTKFLGFGGVRIGWLVADETFVADARRVAHHVPAVSEPSRRLARRALAAAADLGAESRERVRTNRRLLASFVDERDDLAGTVEAGCPFGFLAHVDSSDGDEPPAEERPRSTEASRTEGSASRDGGTASDGGSASAAEPTEAAADTGASGDDVVEAAWEREVLVVPGRFFDDDDRFRVGVCGDPEEMREGLDRLGSALDDLSA